MAQRELQRGMAESRVQGGVGVRDSMAYQEQLHVEEGILPVLRGGYPHPDQNGTSWRGPRDLTGES